MTEEQIGRCVRIAMAAADLNIQGLADAIGVSRPTASGYTKGKYDSPSKLTVVAKACGMTYEEMMKAGESGDSQ